MVAVVHRLDFAVDLVVVCRTEPLVDMDFVAGIVPRDVWLAHRSLVVDFVTKWALIRAAVAVAVVVARPDMMDLVRLEAWVDHFADYGVEE